MHHNTVIYFLPGLGFDHRIYQRLKLKNVICKYLDWIEPMEAETFQNYAKRLAAPIDDATENVVLVGHSLGGMISQEIACFKRVDRIILIASIRSRKELPWYFKMLNPFKIQRIFGKKLTFSTFFFWKKAHDYVTLEEQDLFKSMIEKQSDTYLKWALRQLSIWQTPKVPETTSIFQIHGNKDRTFPLKWIKQPQQIVEDAGHFMVYKETAAMRAFILQHLETK